MSLVHSVADEATGYRESRKWCCRDVGVDVGLMGGTVTQGGDVALDRATPSSP